MSYVDWFENLLRTDDFITTDKFFYASEHSKYIYKKRDFLFRFSRSWNGNFIKPVYIDKLFLSKNILVTGHSDISLKVGALKYLKFLGFKKVFGVNTINFGKFSESVPLGLTNFTNESPLHKIIGNTDHFRSAHKYSKVRSEYDGKIYGNFSLNQISERIGLARIANRNKDVFFVEPTVSDKGRIKYLIDLREFSIVLAPQGNGFDTHRLWETLYMGGTPVIRRCSYLPKILSSLPVIEVENWEEIHDAAKLESLWRNAQTKRSNFQFLESAYWITQFNKMENNF